MDTHDQLVNHLFSKDLDALAEIITKEGNPDSQDKYGRSLLSLAAACGYTDVMAKLVELGADVNAQNGGDLGYTPIIEAARDGRDDVKAIEWLLDNGADIESKDTRNGTAILHACISAYPTVLNYLLAKGAKVDALDTDGQSPLHYLCRYAKGWGGGTFTQTVNGVTTEIENTRFKEHTAIFEILIENGADVNLMTNYGYTPLHLAAESDAAAFIPLLVAKGANVNAANSKEFTPMHAASDRGNIEAVEQLIAHGADLNVVDVDGFSPLLGATMSGNTALVKLLLDKGASVDVKAKISYGKVAEGDTPLDVANKIGNEELIALFG